MGLDVDLNIEVDRDRPDAESDSTTKVMRGGRYGEAYMLNLWNSNHMLADEGSFYTANGTPGTGIAGVVNTGVSETAGHFLYFKNNDTVGNGRAKRIYLDYIRLIVTAVPAAATSMHFFFKWDKVDRYASAGTALSPVNTNGDAAIGAIGAVQAGAIVTIAPSPSARLLTRGVMRSVIAVANDEFYFKSGGTEGSGAIQLGGLVAQRMIIPIAPIIIGPGQNVAMQIWCPSNAVTPPSFEVDCGWVER